ncbi:hypothetical protein [Pararhizobium sp.]|uniref:hypothetical protein n=1 Tax=Pararhizobium sp. TaxID=1977563 RepID=UPI002718087B|nr:hypothetical protein [Pararhizobium sp.]MDO9417448.1 hypothetical protein [Pararhizobium sp.]
MGAFRFKNQETARVDVLPPAAAGRSSHRGAPVRRPDVVDVEFETVPASARRTYPVFNDNLRRPADGKTAASRQRAGLVIRSLMRVVGIAEQALQAASPRIFAALVASIFACVFLGALAAAGLRIAGAQPTAATGLHVAGISTSLDDRDGMQVLSVYGRVVNATSEPMAMPKVLVDVMAGGKRVSTSSLTPQGLAIGSGQSTYFSARLPHAGGKKPEIRVSLAPVGAPGV